MIHLCSAEAKSFCLFILFSVGFLSGQWLSFWSLSWSSTIAFTLVTLVVCRWMARGTPYHIENPLLAANGHQSVMTSTRAGTTTAARSVAIVTGASSGVGYAVAESLAMAGWTVIAAGSDLQRLLLARQKILKRLKKHQNAINEKGDVVVLDTLDLCDEHSVRNFAAKVKESENALPVSVLVNAAGVLKRHIRYSKLTTRWWEVESMLATNAVGPMLLSVLLLPVLQKSARDHAVTSRIINVASSCHTFLSFPFSSSDPLSMIAGLCLERASKLSRAPGSAATLLQHHSGSRSAGIEAVPAVHRLQDFNAMNFVQYYGLSKLCVIWNTQILSEYVSEHSEGCVRVACTHPGVICTHLYRELFSPCILDRFLYYPSLLLGKTWRESAFSTLRAIGEKETEFVDGGYYLCDGDHSRGASNCLSSHACNPKEKQTYFQWLCCVIPEMSDWAGEKKST